MSDYEAVAIGLYQAARNLKDVVNGHYAIHLDELAFDQAKIASLDPDDHRQHFEVFQLLDIKYQTECFALPGKPKPHLVLIQWLEFMDKTDEGMELQIPGQPHFNTRHAHVNENHGALVIDATMLLKGFQTEATGFVDHHKRHSLFGVVEEDWFFILTEDVQTHMSQQEQQG